MRDDESSESSLVDERDESASETRSLVSAILVRSGGSVMTCQVQPRNSADAPCEPRKQVEDSSPSTISHQQEEKLGRKGHLSSAGLVLTHPNLKLSCTTLLVVDTHTYTHMHIHVHAYTHT